MKAEGVKLKVKLDGSLLDLNGVGDESHENLVITREGQSEFTFCKTARKPYDRAVIAILAAGGRTLPGFSWSSDGEPESLTEGAELLAKWAPAQGKAEKAAGKSKSRKGK